MFPRLFACLSAAALLCFSLPAQQIRLVTPTGVGSLTVPPGWKIVGVSLRDNGTRPMMQLRKAYSPLAPSLILFPNAAGKPDPVLCREDVLRPLLDQAGLVLVQDSVRRSQRTAADGMKLALASFVFRPEERNTVPYSQAYSSSVELNLVAFAASNQLCAELKISGFDPSTSLGDLEAALPLFDFQPEYTPSFIDYSRIASALYTGVQAYSAAAVYYQRALDTLPTDHPQHLMLSRLLTDQLAMSYGMSGNLDRSRTIDEAAIARDPDYPLYYYNLACADAESHDAAAARVHLRQAFDRRANMLPGEKMPDPTRDDSIRKLKTDKAFWAFVQSLPH